MGIRDTWNNLSTPAKVGVGILATAGLAAATVATLGAAGVIAGGAAGGFVTAGNAIAGAATTAASWASTNAVALGVGAGATAAVAGTAVAANEIRKRRNGAQGQSGGYSAGYDDRDVEMQQRSRSQGLVPQYQNVEMERQSFSNRPQQASAGMYR